MTTCKIEGLDKLAENLRKDAEKQIVEDARRAGVTARFSRNGNIEFSGSEDSVRKYLKLNPSLQIDADTSIDGCEISPINSRIGRIDSELTVDTVPVIPQRKLKL